MSSNSSTSESESVARDPGGGIGTGLLNFLLGGGNLPQRLSQGQFLLGEAPGGPGAQDLSDDEIAEQLGIKRRTFFNVSTGQTETLPFKEKSLKKIQRFRDKQGEALSPELFSQFQDIFDQLQQQNPLADNFLERARETGAQSQDLFGQSADALSQLISTGSPVDVSALVNEGVTGLKEQFSGLGGLFSSDLQSEALRLGSELNVSAQEAARGRQLGAIGLGQTLGQSQQNFLGSQLGLGTLFEQVATPGGRQLGFINNLFGQQSTNPFSGGTDSFSTTKSKSLGLPIPGVNLSLP